MEKKAHQNWVSCERFNANSDRLLASVIRESVKGILKLILSLECLFELILFQLDYRAAVRELDGLKDENEILRRK